MDVIQSNELAAGYLLSLNLLVSLVIFIHDLLTVGELLHRKSPWKKSLSRT